MAVARRWGPELLAGASLGGAAAVSLAVIDRFGIHPTLLSPIWGVALLASLLLPAAVARSGVDWRRELRLLVLVGLVVGATSIATGLGNNFTDESHAMGGYLGILLAGHDPYTVALHESYRVSYLGFWSASVGSLGASYYTYLPLLLFIQVPGTGAVGYDALALASWGGIVYLVRSDRMAALALASPIVALLAANGFTDLPVLLLVTYALRGPPGRGRGAAELVSYGVKQFANVFWFAYHLVRRDWLRAAGVVAGTAAIAAPFLLWHPTTGIWCEALTFSLGPGCAAAPSSMRHASDFYSHWNYYLWPLWAVALFHGAVGRFYSRLRGRLGRAAIFRSPDDARSAPR